MRRSAAVAPLLCAGITTYSPLRHWKVGPGKKVGVVGLGGLGHMGVKLAHALGAHVVAVHHLGRQERGRARLGADEVVVSKDASADGSGTRAASTSSSTRSPRRTTSTPICSLLQARRHVVLVGVPEHRIRSPTSSA